MAVDTYELSRKLGDCVHNYRSELKFSRLEVALHLSSFQGWPSKPTTASRVLGKIESGTLFHRLHFMSIPQSAKVTGRILDYLAALGVQEEYDVYQLLDEVHLLYAHFRYTKSTVQPYRRPLEV